MFRGGAPHTISSGSFYGVIDGRNKRFKLCGCPFFVLRFVFDAAWRSVVLVLGFRVSG